MVGGLFRGSSRDLAIDLGTANTLIYICGKGVVLRQPSVVAVDKDTGQLCAIGENARLVLGRTPQSMCAYRPIIEGTIAHYELALAMVSHFIRQVGSRRHRGRSVLIGTPSLATEVERRTAIQVARETGAGRVCAIEEPMLGALGSGLSMDSTFGSLVVDIGAGITEAAAISCGGICCVDGIPIAGRALDEAIVKYVRRAYRLDIGETMAEFVKVTIGSVRPLVEELTMTVSGVELATGDPANVQLRSEEIREALLEPALRIVDMVRAVFEKVPPEVLVDLKNKGLALVGGGALLRGMDQLLTAEIGIKAHRAEDPLSCVVTGAGNLLENHVFRAPALMGRNSEWLVRQMRV